MVQHLRIKTKYLKNLNMDLYRTVWELTAQVPKGCVTTYGAIARALGDIRASRAVGQIEHVNPHPIVVPCHRVVYSDGGLGGFGAPEGITKKIKLLASEGVEVRAGKIVDFKNVLFETFDEPEPRPLDMLRTEQCEMAKEIDLTDKIPLKQVRTIAGVDVSYSHTKAFGAVVVMVYPSLEVLDERTEHCETKFPYIPTFLSYHELPIVIQLLKRLTIKPDVIIFDGNGVLHPLGLGLATHAGIILQRPTMGIAKKLLLGEVRQMQGVKHGEIREVLANEQLIGYGLKPKSAKKNLVYISPGNYLSFDSALQIGKRVCWHRVAKPLRCAHNLALSHRKISNRF